MGDNDLDRLRLREQTKRFWVSFLGIIATVIMSLYTASNIWQSNELDRKEDILIDVMNRLDDKYVREVQRKIRLSKLITDQIIELRAVGLDIFSLCKEYKSGKINKAEFERKEKSLQSIRKKTRTALAQASNNMSIEFNDKIEDDIINFTKWDYDHIDLCSDKSPSPFTWLERQRIISKGIKELIEAIQTADETKNRISLAEQQINLISKRSMNCSVPEIGSQ